MADLADEMRIVATDLIDEFGSDVTLQKASSNDYDVATGTTITIDGAAIALKAHIENFDSAEIGNLIFSGDIKCIIAWDATTTYAIDTDKLIFNSISYNIINIEPIITQNKVVTRELQLRK